MLEGVEDTLIARCSFTKLDSNAVFLSGYSRRAVIANNSFTWLGQNGIASWGKPLYNDGTNGDQPRGTVVRSDNETHTTSHCHAFSELCLLVVRMFLVKQERRVFVSSCLPTRITYKYYVLISVPLSVHTLVCMSLCVLRLLNQ